MLHSVAYAIGLHCLLRHAVPILKVITVNVYASDQGLHCLHGLSVPVPWVIGVYVYTPGIRGMLRGYIVFVFPVGFVCLWVNIYFVSKISQELLYLESWNLVHMTSMTSCIVGKKIGAVGSGHLELFPFVVLAFLQMPKHWNHVITDGHGRGY